MLLLFRHIFSLPFLTFACYTINSFNIMTNIVKLIFFRVFLLPVLSFESLIMPFDCMLSRIKICHSLGVIFHYLPFINIMSVNNEHVLLCTCVGSFLRYRSFLFTPLFILILLLLNVCIKHIFFVYVQRRLR